MRTLDVWESADARYSSHTQLVRVVGLAERMPGLRSRRMPGLSRRIRMPGLRSRRIMRNLLRLQRRRHCLDLCV
jgi:hypothetical protein